jgi:hypothetical protein
MKRARISSFRDALQRISTWFQVHFRDRDSPSSDTGGYCQAAHGSMRRCSNKLAEQLERQVTNQQL